MSMMTMLSLVEVKKLMGDESISDEQAAAIRDACYFFAELLLDAWQNTRARGGGDREKGDEETVGGGPLA